MRCIRHPPGVYRVCRTRRHDDTARRTTLRRNETKLIEAPTTNRGFLFLAYHASQEVTHVGFQLGSLLGGACSYSRGESLAGIIAAGRCTCLARTIGLPNEKRLCESLSQIGHYPLWDGEAVSGYGHERDFASVSI